MTRARDKANSTVTNFASTGIDDNASSTALTTTATGVDVTGILKVNSIETVAGKPILNSTGSVLQVVTAVQSSGVTNSTNTWTDTSLSASITPSQTSSKILVLVTQPAVILRTVSDNWLGGIKLLRGSTVIGNGDAYTLGQSHPSQNPTSGGTYWWYSSHELDSPSTTSSVTYKTQSRADSSGSVATLASSRITLIEIAG